MKILAFAPALAAALVCGPAAAQGPVAWQEQVLSGVCTLRFAVPEGWSAESHEPAAGAVKIRIVPKAGSRGEVLVTGLAPKNDSSLRSAGDIRKLVKTMGEELLPGAGETRLELQRVKGTDGAGYFYSLTEKSADLPEGGYRFMTQGVMAIGPLRVAVTVLADAKGSPVEAAAFELLRTAECAGPKR